MKLATTIARSLQVGMQAELGGIERAVSAGTKAAGSAVLCGANIFTKAPRDIQNSEK